MDGDTVVTRHLLPALVALGRQHEFVYFLDARAADTFDLKAPNLRAVLVKQSRSPTEAASADGNRSPVDMLRLTGAVWRERLDVFFSPSVYTYFPLPSSRRWSRCTMPSRSAFPS